MLAIKSILFPTDFSDASQPAFHLACSLARDHGSKLVLLHVITPAVAAYTEGIMLPPTVELKDELWGKLEEIPVPEEIMAERHMTEGQPAAEILRLAQEMDADLIVMGCHGRRGFTRILMGSVAEEVVRKAPCPVLTVKVPQSHLVQEPAEEKLAGSV